MWVIQLIWDFLEWVLSNLSHYTGDSVEIQLEVAVEKKYGLGEKQRKKHMNEAIETDSVWVIIFVNYLSAEVLRAPDEMARGRTQRYGR